MANYFIHTTLALTCCFGARGIFSADVNKGTSAPIVINSGNLDGMLTPFGLIDYAGFAQQGYTHQVVSAVTTFATYDWISPGIYPSGSPQEKWREDGVKATQKRLAAVRQSGMKAISSLDIFVVPEPLFYKFHEKMADPADARRIDLNNFTLALMDGLMTEIFQTFPDLDGIMVRVGENYGGPKVPNMTWVANGAVKFTDPFVDQQGNYIRFISQLRESVCVKHNKQVFFRTWDTSGFSPTKPARFHPSLPYYLNVTNYVSTHKNLIFSIKHTSLDFWRYVRFNPCITQGNHQQVIEVEAQREYEGKGAFPVYIADGVIDGFNEFPAAQRVGLRHVIAHPLVVGLWTWSGGGGWYGPNVHNATLWPQLNTFVTAKWVTMAAQSLATPDVPDRSQTQLPSAADAFAAYCLQEIAINDSATCTALYNISVLSQDAVLALRYVAAYDGVLPGSRCGALSCMPTNNWLRDDRLGGLQLLGQRNGAYGNPGVIFWLIHNNTSDEPARTALAEKARAIELFAQIVAIANSIDAKRWPVLANEVLTTSVYGWRLSAIVRWGWEVMILGFRGDVQGHYNCTGLLSSISSYDQAWRDYNNTLRTYARSATAFLPVYEGGSKESQVEPGLGASVNAYRNYTKNCVPS
eukprot:m.1349075 g.1349075  ORF g.1349075 m.1349075 type:complete len:637 (-) comp24917_c0_seq8:2345-4255(-)